MRGDTLRGVPTKPFSLLADVYDAIMDDIHYEGWAEFILREADKVGWGGQKVLDLGCGTGNSAFPFFSRGYTLTGLDASAQMLAVAREKLPPVRFVQGNFTSFDLGETFDLVISVFDSLNNLLEPRHFLQTAERVYHHLAPGGLFIFDVNTTVGLRDLWESGRAEGWVDEVHYSWDHTFDEATRIGIVTAYCEKNGRAFTEVHVERAYDPPELRDLLAKAGFAEIKVLTYPSGEPAQEDEERVWVVAKR